MYKEQLSQDNLKWLFDYDVIQGRLIRMVHSAGRPAKERSPNSNGYYVMMVRGERYYEHRLIWLYHYGELPSDDLVIDHIDGNRMNNRIENLQLLTRYENMIKIV